jgi:hypothetical protein
MYPAKARAQLGGLNHCRTRNGSRSKIRNGTWPNDFKKSLQVRCGISSAIA